MDFGMTPYVKITKTKVTRAIFKTKGSTYISTKDKLEIKDVIQTGRLRLKYRIIKQERISDYHWFTYKIKRIDNNLTTSTDIDNSSKGDLVLIVNRKTFEELFLDYPHTDLDKIGSMKPRVGECKICIEATEDCKCKSK